MRRFFILLFVVSLLATAAAIYWQNYLPEGIVSLADESQPSAPQGRGDKAAPSARMSREEVKQPSDRQNMAVTISILSSIISAVAAVAQTWLTARAYRR